MITIRQADKRGHTNLGWLDSKHSFSFGQYYDPDNMGFRSLRVINDDRVAPGAGFGEHPHRDMEILSYVVDGGLSHHDSSGSQSVVHHGMVQKMSAGSGITHSEFNASKTDSVRFLQVWLRPETDGITPSYEEQTFSTTPSESLHLIASPNGSDTAVRIHQDASIYAGILNEEQETSVPLLKNRYGWLQVVHGSIETNGTILSEGDGARIENESEIGIKANSNAEFLFFDLA